MLLRNHCGLLGFPKLLIVRKNYSSDKTAKQTTAYQLSLLLGIEWNKSREIISHHQKLATMKFEDIKKNVQALEKLNYTKEQFRQYPTLLYTGPVSLLNRHRILVECGCVKLTAGTLSKYIVMMNRQIRIIKTHGIIPDDTSVLQKLLESFTDVKLKAPPLQQNDDSQMLKTVREMVLNLYLKEKFQMSEQQIKKLWHSYYRIRHKSFQSITEMANILTNDLNFPPERIIKNSYLLYGEPENVRRFLEEIRKIGDEDIREILYRRPKIMMVDCDGVKKSIKHILSFGIAEESITKCLDILTLGSDTVLERLQDMNNVDEFRALKSNARILRLVHYQTKARIRLEYLNQLKIKCASLHVLSAHTDAFTRYTKDGADKGKGCDNINYLAKVMKRSPLEVRDVISRHPNWCHVPTFSLTRSFDFLTNNLFTPNDIFPNLQILLYPVERIKTKLQYLQVDTNYAELKLDNFNCMSISNQQMLALVLYLIELEFHFTGDGIWTDHDLHPVENFNSILPDFPASWQKGYKYGTTKPSPISKLDDDNSGVELAV